MAGAARLIAAIYLFSGKTPSSFTQSIGYACGTNAVVVLATNGLSKCMVAEVPPTKCNGLRSAG